MEHESGGYWDYCDFPLQNATIKEIEAWPLPSADDYDYSRMPGLCKQHDGYAIVAGGAATVCIMNTAGF